jgi:serine/threonine-protein kinase
MYRSADSAAALVRSLGLEPNLKTVDVFSPAGKGTVAGQTPDAGSSVANGSRVSLLIASGSVEVPDVIGLAEDAAWQVLQSAGLQVQTVRVASNKTSAGLAANVQPAPGVVVPSGARVTLAVSQGH